MTAKDYEWLYREVESASTQMEYHGWGYRWLPLIALIIILAAFWQVTK